MSASSPSVGNILGHYRLIEQIGRGGMGVVYRARDEKLPRDVAVKILPPRLFGDAASREQFRQEAFAVGCLNHPNIATAFDFDAANGIDYLVTEYIPGIDLDQKINQEPLPQETVLKYGVQLMSALAAAHRENVIHRDLKPSNIRLNRDGQLKVLDFGLAKLIDPIEDNAKTIDLKNELSVSGTLPYMAPELLRGEPPDARVDIWAAGAVLYEMATGKRAFPEKQSTLLTDSILHHNPIRPSQLNPGVSAGLEAVILRALERDCEYRYQSAEEMRADLERLLLGNEVQTATLERSRAMKLATRKKRRGLAFGLIAVLLAGISIGYVSKRLWIPQRQKIMAVLPIDTDGQDAATTALGVGLMETLTAKLAEASGADSIEVVSSRDLRDKGVKTAEDARREFGTDLVLESSLQRDGSSIRVNSFLVDAKTHRQLAARSITVASDDSFGLQDKVVGETFDMLPTRIDPEQRRKLTVRPDTKPEAYAAYIRGRGYLVDFNKPEDIDNAIAAFTEAIKLDPNYALGYAGLGKTYWAGFEHFFRDNDWMDKASRNCRTSLSLNPDLVEGHICLGNVYNGTGQYQKAAEEFQLAVKSEPGSEDGLRGLADAYSKLGNLAGAENAYKQVIALRPKYWAAYSWLGAFYADQNRYADAAEAFRQATELAPDSYLGYMNLGSAYAYEGRYEDAIEAFKRSAELHPNSDAYNNLGYIYTLMKRYPDAIAALQQGLKVDNHDWMNWGNLADAFYWSSAPREQSTGNYRKAVSLATSKLQVNPGDAQTLAYLADYSAMLGDAQSARSFIGKALQLDPGNGEVLLRAAIVYYHLNQTEEALNYLRKAVQVGYSRNIIRDTPDFSNLLQDPRFRAIVEHN